MKRLKRNSWRSAGSAGRRCSAQNTAKSTYGATTSNPQGSHYTCAGRAPTSNSTRRRRGRSTKNSTPNQGSRRATYYTATHPNPPHTASRKAEKEEEKEEKGEEPSPAGWVTHEVYTLTERKEKVDVERLVAELEELRRSLTMTAKAIDERLEQIIHTLKAEQAAYKQAEEEVDVEAGRVGEEHTPAETSPAAEAPSTVRPPPALRPDQLPPLFRGQAAQRAEK